MGQHKSILVLSTQQCIILYFSFDDYMFWSFDHLQVTFTKFRTG